MKLSKLLLSTILIGVTLQSISSCTNDDPKPNTEEGEDTSDEEVLDDCPACGMG